MGTVFLTNLAAVVGKYERYDVLSTILDFETHNRLPLKPLRKPCRYKSVTVVEFS